MKECTIWVWGTAEFSTDPKNIGWPTADECPGDVPLVIRGECAILWRARCRGSKERKKFDYSAGAVLADRLEEHPEETDNPELARLVAGFLRRQWENYQTRGY